MPVRHVTVVRRVPGLYARRDPQLGEARQVLGAQQLRVLDPAAAAHHLEGVQGNGVGAVTDGVHGGFDAVRGGVPHEPYELAGAVSSMPWAPSVSSSPG